jgi:hypothetical protein
MNPPEIELCLLLSRAQLSPQAWERALELLSTPLRWEFLFERAEGFGLFPLLYTGLEALGFQAVPDAVRADWARLFRIHAIRTELIAGELVRILRSLSDAGIPVMPLKGVALAESLYGDPALRVSDDIDVLVPARRAMEAFHVLVASGYQSDLTGRPRLLELNMRYSRDCLLIRHDRAHIAALELHSGLAWGGTLERGLLEQVWAEARPMTFRGAPAFAMSTEWEFLYLAINALRHAGASLKWYADLDRLCSRRPVDWKKVSERAKSLGWEAPVRAILQLCGSFFETPLDPVFASAPQAPLSRVPPPSDVLSPSDNLFLLGLLGTPARKLRYLAIRLFIPTLADCEFLSLPQSLFFLYYPLRPFRVAAKVTGWYLAAGIRKLFRLFRRLVPR